ncbi:MAG: Tail Collar domain protein, partial [Nevskia sp.]|nr:Tail Collar domain protein [Nevskia sp.]
MSQPFVGEIRIFAGNFAPSGWNFCDGSLLSIADN